MGSTGTGSFGNYSPTEKPQCDESIESDLEEIARAAYYSTHRTVPPTGTKVRLYAKPLKGRLLVETKKGEGVGLLPTALNRFLLCLEKGFSYSGEITASHSGKIPTVSVSLAAKKP